MVKSNHKEESFKKASEDIAKMVEAWIREGMDVHDSLGGGLSRLLMVVVASAPSKESIISMLGSSLLAVACGLEEVEGVKDEKKEVLIVLGQTLLNFK